MNRFFACCLSALLVFMVGCAAPKAEEADAAGDGPFPATKDAMADVDAALIRAVAADRKLLLVLGANWCHDSEALIKHLETVEIAELIDAHFEVELINVGWFERGFDVAERFGLAIYTHTPTLLLIDPASERVLNAHDQHIFRDADKMKPDEVLRYLELKTGPAGWTELPPPEVAASPVYQALMADIRAFEETQALRIREGYRIIAPELEADSDDLMTLWRPVRGLRYRLPDDLVTLRREAWQRVEDGETEIDLTYPEYPPFPWEKEAGSADKAG